MEINCSWEYFKDTNFLNYSVSNIKNCLINSSTKIGENIWAGQGYKGFLILVALVFTGYFIYKQRRKI